MYAPAAPYRASEFWKNYMHNWFGEELIWKYEKGYNLVVPDLEGFGYNKRIKGDFCWNEHLENSHDTVKYTRAVFNGPVFLGGASMGGPLAYAADARYNCANGLIFGRIRLKTTRFISYRYLSANSYFNSLIMKDPQAGNTITLRGALSLILVTKPELSHELYEKPVLVCQPKDDKMTPAFYTKKTFEKLKSGKKRYVELDGAHFPTESHAYKI
jgi:fermentation-respiration switch protein FrsA (DUF1100 family)